jgi:glycine dehydrogenase subunit 1
LLVTAATIHMSLLGAKGLEHVAASSQMQTRKLVDALTRIRGVKLAFDSPRFHEAVLQLEKPVEPILAALAERGVVGGYDLSKHYPELDNALLVCATETKTDADIEQYARALREVME